MKKNLLCLLTSVALLPASVAFANPYADYNPSYNPNTGRTSGGYRGGDYDAYGEANQPTHNGNANKDAYQQMMNSINVKRSTNSGQRDPYYDGQQHYPSAARQRDERPEDRVYGDPHYDDGRRDSRYDEGYPPNYDERAARREMEHPHHPSGYDSMGHEMGHDERQYRQERYVSTGEHNALSGPPSGSVFRSSGEVEAQRRYERNMQRGYDDSYQPIRKPPTQDTNRSRWR